MPGFARTKLAAGHFVGFKLASVGLLLLFFFFWSLNQLVLVRVRLITEVTVTPE